MMRDKPLEVIAGAPDRPLSIGDIEIQCYVLEDETRVLSQSGMFAGLGLARSGLVQIGGGAQMPRFATSKSLKPYIPNELTAGLSSPKIFQPVRGGRTAYGLVATILADICEAVLLARGAGSLTNKQERLADRCEFLMRGFARVGIIALVDEATGYQRIREERALAKILERYIADELQPWTKTFPYNFYEGIVKLKQWPSIYAIKRPSIIGRYTNNIVYERIEDGLYHALRRKNPKLPAGYRKHKHHQWFTPEHGHPKLEEHISNVSTLMRVAANWKSFYETLLPRAFPKKREQIPLALDD